MHKRLVLLLVGVFAFSFAKPCWSQCYAPDTEYHDRAQRRFVVELARIMAWRENARGRKPDIAEVAYEVETTAETGQTAWKVHWLDSAGKSLRDFSVSYDASALAPGLDFYRSVALSMLTGAKEGNLSEADVSKAWWTGAEMAGDSRTESLRAAFTLDPKKPENAPKLAGLLAHAALPSVSRGVSLDCVLLARAAAWLAIAESQLKAGEKAGDGLWAPILFLSGRENAAADIWQKSPATGDTLLEKWWGFLLSKPRASDAFAFAAEKQNRRRALPLLVYESWLFSNGGALVSVVHELFRDEKSLYAQHDYGPFIELNGGVTGGRIMEGAWPLLSRMDWIECMKSFQPEASDFHGYADALKKVKNVAPTSRHSSENDPSVAGLADAADLINLGFTDGVGKLTPVATVTARDLLNFGWEMNGVQIGARWNFVRDVWGVSDLADSIAKTMLANIDGSEVFLVEYPYGFRASRPPDTWGSISRTRVTDFKRLQDIDGPPGEWMVPFRAFTQDKKQNARFWMRRCWLTRSQLLFQCREFYFAGLRNEVAPELRRLRAEGGAVTDAGMLPFFVPGVGLNAVGLKECPGTDDVRHELIDSQPEPSGNLIAAAWVKLDVVNKPFENAQGMEKVFWQRPGDDLPYHRIFSEYIRAHAYQSAKRFYSQAENLIEDRVAFSNSIGPRRLMLAVLEKDEPAIAEALRASDTGSYQSMVMRIIAAAAREDIAAIKKQVAECMERYPFGPSSGGEDMMVKLKGFLPLLPALKDPKNPGHEKALDYFGSHTQWPTLQWVLAENAKLSPEEAVRFFGGQETDFHRRFLVAYVLKEKALFRKTYQDFEKERRSGNADWSNTAFVLVHHLHSELFELPVPPEQPDLKPPAAKSLRQIFMEKLAKSE